MGKGEDVCSINVDDANNKYMVSTYSLPERIASPQGEAARSTPRLSRSGSLIQSPGGWILR
jgi:hypothetical protein